MGKETAALKGVETLKNVVRKNRTSSEDVEQFGVRSLLRSHYDLQLQRIVMAGRLKLKVNGDTQEGDIESYIRAIPESSFSVLTDSFIAQAKHEAAMAKQLQLWVESQSFYTDWLSNVKGLGPIMGSVIMAEFDIRKADTVSKLWAYAGVSPGMVHGKVFDKKTKEIVVKEDSSIRQDRLSKGYLCPYNGFLKSKLLGVLASSFMIHNPTYKKVYDDYKNRLVHQHGGDISKLVGTMKGSDGTEYPATKIWIHKRAIRQMMKIFLIDLYVAWRTHEGLPVRPPYQEEYLGHKHSGPSN